jgi:putative DNA methylase
VDALRTGGFEVTEAWPLATEMPGKVGWQVAAMLASSIFLVARKRGPALPLGGGVGGGTTPGVGNYATEVRPEMVRIVAERVHDLMAVGLTGADLVIAAVGAGLRPFTRFDAVELPNGEPLGSDRFLDEVQREVLEAVLTEVFEVDRAGVGQVDRASRFFVLARYQYGEVEVEFGTMNVLAQGLGIELTGPGSLSDGPHAVIAQARSMFRVRGFEERGADPQLGLPLHGAEPSLVDVLHRLLWLMDQDRAKILPFLAESHTDLGRLRLLANALKGRTLSDSREGDARTGEQKAVDRLLAQWSRLAESRDLGPLFSK